MSRVEEKADPGFHALPRYWVAEAAVDERLERRWNSDWLLGWRDITLPTNERTMIAAAHPIGPPLPTQRS